MTQEETMATDNELTIPCPCPPSRSGIGGQMMTACPICREVNGSTVLANHRPVVVRELIERLRGTEDYDLVLAELTWLREERARQANVIRSLDMALTHRLLDEVESDPWDEVVAERNRMRAALRYLRAAAHLFPHVNTDRATTTQLGLPDAEDVWCLGCTVAATIDWVIEGIDNELLGAGADEYGSNDRARQWMADYETSEPDERS